MTNLTKLTKFRFSWSSWTTLPCDFLHGDIDDVGDIVNIANIASAFFHLFDAIGGKIYAMLLKI